MGFGPFLRFLSLAAVLFAFWLLLSGHYTPYLLTVGVVSALGVAAFGRVLGYSDAEGHPIELTFAGLMYWPWLIREILVSAVQVSAIILHPRLPISPRMIKVPASQPGPVGLVTYANSITLTPGTITARVNEAERTFEVHALTRDSAGALMEGEMDRRVTAMARTA